MARIFAVMACATLFVLCLVAIWTHAALIRTGYEVTALERTRDTLEMEAACSREQVNHLGSPAVLSKMADDLGLNRAYPKEFGVVRVAPLRVDGPVMVRSD